MENSIFAEYSKAEERAVGEISLVKVFLTVAWKVEEVGGVWAVTWLLEMPCMEGWPS